jgi:hypothetical protein
MKDERADVDSGQLEIIRDGDGVYYRSPQARPEEQGQGGQHSENIAERMSETNLTAVADTVTENIAFDEQGMQGTEEIAEKVHDLMGLKPEGSADTDDELCNKSSHPLMLTAIMRFQAKALAAILPVDDAAVRTEPVEDLDLIENKEEKEAAEKKIAKIERRVQDFYTDYLFNKLTGYETDTDLIIQDMAITGIGVRKVVVDTSRESTPVIPERVPAGDIIVSYDTNDFSTGRVTHKMDIDTATLIRRMNAGIYRSVQVTDENLPELSTIQVSRDEMHGFQPGHRQESSTHRVCEVYTSLYLKDDPHPEKIPRPYIVTIHAQSRKVLSVRRNWQPDDPDETPLEHFVGYIYHPGRNGVTGVGLGQILMQTTEALRTAQRRMLEAGYLQNHPSGFKSSSLSIRDDETRVRAGEFVDVDIPNGDIRSALYMQPFEGPSQGLMALSSEMLANGKELGGVATVDFSQLMKSGVAAGPAMAAFEESTEFQTAAHRRLYKAHRKELEIIHERMRTVRGGSSVNYTGDRALQPGDLQAVNILPFMKPGQASKQRAIMEAQAVWDLAKESPDILDRKKAAENYIRALGSPDANDLLSDSDQEESVQPADPVTEYGKALAGQPIAAGIAQNHQAHIDSHTAQLRMLQDSSMPVDQGDAVSSVLSAHIAEHMGMQLMAQVAARTDIPMETFGPNMPPELEQKVAPAIAEAIQSVEKMRQPKSEGDQKIALERVKQEGELAREQVKIQGKMTEQQMRQQQEAELTALKHRHDKELREMQEKAAMDREVESNTADVRIARLKEGLSPLSNNRGNS